MIEDLISSLGYSVPWQFWLIPGTGLAVGAFVLVSRTFGFRNGLYAAAVVAFAATIKIIESRAAQRGWEDRIKKEKRDGDRMVERAERAGRAVSDVDPERLRDDDGFKRR